MSRTRFDAVNHGQFGSVDQLVDYLFSTSAEVCLLCSKLKDCQASNFVCQDACKNGVARFLSEELPAREPRQAALLTRNREVYSVEAIYYGTGQVTLRESPKVFNTVNFKDVEFIYDDDMSQEEIASFKHRIGEAVSKWTD